MVPSEALEQLKKAHSKFMLIKAPDIFVLDASLQVLFFDVFTLDSVLAGLSQRLIDNKEFLDLSKYNLQDEVIGIDSLKSNKSFDSLNENEKNKITEYLLCIEELRKSVCHTIK